MKGESTMLVKAKWNVKDNAGWHEAGEVFNTDSDLGDAVEVLDAPKKVVKTEEPKAEPKPEAVAEEKPKAAPRRKTAAK